MGANGTLPNKRLGTWTTISTDTVYHAGNDLFIVSYGTAIDSTSYYQILSDDLLLPATIRDYHHGYAVNQKISVSSMVKKGDYFKIVRNNANSGYSWCIGLRP